MADNVPLTPNAAVKASTEEVTTLNGAVVEAQHVQRMVLALRTANGTAVDADPATQATLAAILTELGQKLETGGTVTSLPPVVSAVLYEQITVAAAGGVAIGLTPPGTADFAVVIPSVAVRWRDDATDPTAAVGMPIAAGVPVTFDTALGVVEFIAQGASAGVLDVAYYAV